MPCVLVRDPRVKHSCCRGWTRRRVQLSLGNLVFWVLIPGGLITSIASIASESHAQSGWDGYKTGNPHRLPGADGKEPWWEELPAASLLR